LSIVKVSGRRIYIPQEIPFSAKKVLLIPIGVTILIVPIPDKPTEVDIPFPIEEIKKLAETKAKKDALRKIGGSNNVDRK